MALSFKEKRELIEEMVLKVVGSLEKGHTNLDRYKAMFNSMNDKEFEEWANKFEEDNFEQCIQVFNLPFEEPTMDNIEHAADLLGLPLDEYVWFRNGNMKDVRTPTRVPVGYLHIKRAQQLLRKKNRYTVDNTEVSLKTGQTTGDSKVAANSDQEAYALKTISADKALEEFYSFRADSQYKKSQAYKSITDYGYVSLSELVDDATQHTAVNTLNTYMLASGLMTDLISKGLKTEYTIKQDLYKKK